MSARRCPYCRPSYVVMAQHQSSQTMPMSGFRGPLFAEVFGNIRTKFAQSTGFRPLLKSRPADLLRKTGAEGGI